MKRCILEVVLDGGGGGGGGGGGVCYANVEDAPPLKGEKKLQMPLTSTPRRNACHCLLEQKAMEQKERGCVAVDENEVRRQGQTLGGRLACPLSSGVIDRWVYRLHSCRGIFPARNLSISTCLSRATAMTSNHRPAGAS